MTGTLNEHRTIGSTKAAAVRAQGTAGADGTLRVTGTHQPVRTEFGFESFPHMLGTMLVGDSAKVSLDLNLKN